MFRQYRPIETGELIVIGGDCAAGGKDRSCCQFLSKTKMDVPLVYHSGRIAREMTNEIYPVIEKIHDITGIKPTVAYERNNGGVFELERLAAMNRAGKYDIFKMPSIGKDLKKPEELVRLGWDTNSSSRPAMLVALKDAIDNLVLTIYDKPTIEEMFSFIVCQTSSAWKAQAERNSHDDCVMSLAIAWQLALRVQAPLETKERYYEEEQEFNPMTV